MRIREAAKKTGRTEKDITLIGVTKTVNEDIIRESIRLGITDIGENRVQEMVRKYENIHEDVNWHMIGHLQTNKVKYVIDKVYLIHSLDRMSLAKELQKRASNLNITVNTLVQVNIAEEDTKFGLIGDEVIPFIEKILDFNNLRIKGLMTIAPFDENPENVRHVFRQLKGLAKDIESKGYETVEMKYLSMGMTNDFEIAIEEGSNMVRIGTGIFGERIY